MVSDLATNNALRGSWAEQLVAHYLSIADMPPNWSYYDMRDHAGRDVSVKHSVGPRPSFAVSMAKWAWDPELADEHPRTDGWRGGEGFTPQYWCHAYVFAWLDAPVSAPELDLVLDSDRWRFGALSRAEMYDAFAPSGVGVQKSVGLARLRELTDLAPGDQLADKVRAIPSSDVVGVPPRLMTVTYAEKLGPPVEVVTGVLPEALAPPETVDEAP
jgi:hypothetical protein